MRIRYENNCGDRACYGHHGLLTARWLLALLMLLVWSQASVWAGAFVLVEDGQARAVVVEPVEGDRGEKLAVAELVEHVAAITGVELPVVSADAWAAAKGVGLKPIWVGAAAGEKALQLARSAGPAEAPEAFGLIVTSEAVWLRGVGPAGTQVAVYELLEQLGVRWFMPGPLGTVLPEARTLTLAEQRTGQAPSFALRGISNLDRTWTRRLRLGGDGASSSLTMPRIASFDEHPDYFAIVDGQRHPGQLCLSNPAVFDAMVATVRAYFAAKPDAESMAMGNHGGGHCECADCRAMDTDQSFGPFTAGRNVSDRYVAFLNRVLEAIHDDLPTRRIALTIATPDIAPPARETGHPNLDIMAWVNAYCRIHGVNNPACPERQMVFRQTRAWVDSLEGHYYERTNWGNIAGPGLIFPAVHRYRQDLPAYHAIGVRGVRGANYGHWISQLPSDYIGAKLLWNHEANVDALLADFYQQFYGQAAGPMQQYHELIEHTARDADHHTGTALDAHHIFTADVRQQAKALLGDAQQQVDEGIYQQRIEAVALALEYLDAFARMMALRDRHAYAEALQAKREAEAARDQLIDGYDPPLLTANFARRYFDIFFGRIVEQAAQRVTAPNVLLAGLDDVWQFQLDTQAIGEQLQWWSPQSQGGNWQPIHAWSQSWSNQGLRYYHGLAWYRQTVSLPEALPQRVMLWFGGVDEHATVWVNGQRVGESHRSVFKPFEFDVTDVVKAGLANTVVVRIENLRVDEVGTGGLLGPVMFYGNSGDGGGGE